MQIDLNKQELIVMVNLLSQARFTIAESQLIYPLFEKLSNTLKNFKE